MSPVFLDLSEVLRIHRDQIERYGGEPSIRDLGLLQSAIMSVVPVPTFSPYFIRSSGSADQRVARYRAMGLTQQLRGQSGRQFTGGSTLQLDPQRQ